MLERAKDWAVSPTGRAVLLIFALALAVRLITVAVIHPDPRDGPFRR
jgi:hypothetical protein